MRFLKIQIPLLVALFIFSYSSWGQHTVFKNDKATQIIENAKSVSIRKDSSIAFVKIQDQKSISRAQFVEENKKALGLNANDKLETFDTHHDNLGFNTEKCKQLYKGIEVFGAVYVFHQKNGKLVSANGRIVPDLDVDITPSLSEEQALSKALENINAVLYRWQADKIDPNQPKAELMISSADYSFKPEEMKLVYSFEIYALQPLGKYHIEIDAKTGEIVNKYDMIHHVETPATGESLYNGTVSFTADMIQADLFKLRIDSKNITTQSLKNATFAFGNEEDVTSIDNSFDVDSVRAAASIHWATEASYDYYFDRFGISGYNSNTHILAFADYGTNQANAFWDGYGFYYGNGVYFGPSFNDNTTPHVSLDIVGHEYTHAITYFSSGLIYQNESGSLTESFSDIFGHNIEVYKNPTGWSWSQANEVFPEGGSYREMSNPKLRNQPDTYNGEFWYTGTANNGGVHTNSGVQNHWYYLLTDGGSGTNDKGYIFNVQGIGLAKAEQIAYRNLTSYITSTSNYPDARVGAEQAAIDLYGDGSPEHMAVSEAWNAVGVPASMPVVYAAPTRDFNNVYVSASDTLDLNILNLGLGDLTVTDITIDNALFAVDQTSFVISSDSNYVVKVSYSPTLVQSDNATLTIVTSAGSTDVQLTGTAVDFPVMELSTNTLSGVVNSGDQLVKSFTIDNTGIGDLIWSLSTDTPLSANTSSGTIISQGSTQVDITLDATGIIAGDYQYDIVITSSDSLAANTILPFMATVTGSPEIMVIDTIKLGIVYAGFDIKKSVLINNTGYDSLKIDSLRYSSNSLELGQYDEIFVLALDSTQLELTFENLQVGVFIDSITISSNAPLHKIYVTGTVNPAPISIDMDTLNFTINSSSSDSTIITLTNLENFDISWDFIASDTFSISTASIQPRHAVTKAVMIRTLDLLQMSSVWNSFNNRFNDVELDITSLNKIGITYQDLVNSEADVLVIGRALFTTLAESEIDAIIRYVSEGHGFVGYYGAMSTFNQPHNRFAPLWGLSKNTDYTHLISFDRTSIKTRDHEVFESLPEPITLSNGFTILAGKPWAEINLVGELLASSQDEKAIVIRNFNRIYFSDYRISNSSSSSHIFLRNAIKFADKSFGSVEVGSPSGTLVTGSSEQIKIKVHTAGLIAGSYQYFLNLYNASGDQLISKVPVNLEVIGIPIIKATDSLDFPNTNIGATLELDLIIENDGASDLVIDDMAVSGTAFSLSETFPIIIPSFKTYTSKITFQPNQAGDFLETIFIRNNDTTSQDKPVILTGTGLSIPQMNVSETAISVTLVEGGSTTRSIEIQNVGTETLIWNGSSSLGDVMKEFDLPAIGNGWFGAVYLNDKVYVGHFNSGQVYTFDPVTKNFDLIFDVTDNRVTRMTTDGFRIYTQVSGFGVYKYDLNGFLTDFFTFDNNVYIPIVYRNGEMWRSENSDASISNSINKMDLDGNTLASYPLSSPAKIYGLDWIDDETLLIIDRESSYKLKQFKFDGTAFTLVDSVTSEISNLSLDLSYQFPNVWSPTFTGKLQRIDYSGNSLMLTPSGSVLPDMEQSVSYKVKSDGLSPGTYQYHLDFTSDDPSQTEPLIVPINLTVIANPVGNIAPLMSLNDISMLEDAVAEIDLEQRIEDLQSPFNDLTISFQVLSAQSDEVGNIATSDMLLNRVGNMLQVSTTPGINGVFIVEITAQDPQGLSAIATIQVTINAINDAPGFSLLGNQQTTDAGGLVSVLNFATAITDNDHGTQGYQFITTNDNIGLFSTQPFIDAQGSLTYTVNAGMTGEANVTVTMQDDGGVAFGGEFLSTQFAFTINVSSQDGPNAYYHFDNGDANDYAGSYHAASTVGLTYQTDTRQYVDLDGTTGLITLPSELSNDLFSQSSLELSFDIKLTTGQPICIMSAQTPISSAFWQNPGFSIYSTIGTTANLVFAYGDNTTNSSSTITNLALDQWHSVQLSVDLNTGYWKFIVNGQSNVGTFFSGFNSTEFKNAVGASTFTIGGYGGIKPSPWYGQIGLDELKLYFPSPGTTNDIRSAYHWLYQDLIAAATLSEVEKQAYLDTIKLGLPFANYSLVQDSLFAYTSKYEELNPPLFTPNANTHILEENMPLHDQVVLFSQGHIFDSQFIPDNMEFVDGIKFEFGELFPGVVSDIATRTIGGTAEINGTYNIDIAAEYGMQEFVVRPTGYFLAAGDTVTIEVPSGYENQGLSVVVGVHFRNLVPSLGAINRPRDISLEYPITTTKTKIANPYGGGIYIKVPDGTILGWFNVTINHAVKSPYFSWRAGRQTNVADWLNEIQNTDAPWADFESDKYMFTIPISNASATIIPDQVMARWDSIMDGFRIAGGRPTETRIRAEFYTADRKLVTPAYGSGYPTVITLPELNFINSNWDPITALTVLPSPILLHEMGHTARHPTMEYSSDYSCEFEAETIVHVPMAYVNESVYQMSPDSAFANSGVSYQVAGFDEAAFDWIITDNFRNNIPMSYDATAPMADKDQLKYQNRGWAKYLDIARAYSWDTVSLIFGKYYTEGVQQSSTVTCNPAFQNIAGRDEFIQYASDVTGENMAPLFHFWGINPTESLATSLAGLPKSQRIKELIDNYFCIVAPQSLADYTIWHNKLYLFAGYQQPRYDKYLAEFDASYVTDINNQFTLILNKYGLYGPTAPTDLTLSATGNTANLNWTDNSSNETGFVIRYKLTGSADYTTMITVGAGITTYSTPNLAPGTYEFMVTAINAENLESTHCDAINGSVAIDSFEPVFISISACDTYSFAGQDLMTSGEYSNLFTSSQGYDSLANLTLTILESTSGAEAVSTCDTYDWEGITYTTSGDYIATLINAVGCDSLATLTLTILESTSGSESVSTCDSYDWEGTTYTTSGDYMTTLMNAVGCDSTATLNLTINPTFEIGDAQEICFGASYTFPDGTSQENITAAMGYTSDLLSQNSCDSLVTTQITVSEQLDVEVTQNGTNLFARADDVTYQWVNCAANFEAIDGETDKRYQPKIDGEFAVTISDGECSQMSACFTVDITVLAIAENKRMISFYPNPTKDEVHIELGQFYDEVRVEVIDITGGLAGSLYETFTNQMKVNLNGKKGIYLIRIFSGERHLKTIRILKE